MSVLPPADSRASRNGARSSGRLLRQLERPGDAVRHFGPNWFTSVMGTAIVGVAATKLPLVAEGLTVPATVVWLAALVLLVLVLSLTAAHWLRFPQLARAELVHPIMANFVGAVSMAFTAVAAGFLPLGSALIGDAAASALAWACWLTGTAIGIGSAIFVPIMLFVRHSHDEKAAFMGWLMPIVPPMVSSAVGIGLVDTLSSLEAQRTLLVVCAMLFGTTIIPALIVIGLVWQRLLRFGVGPAHRVPMLAIALGPLGQSATSAIALGTAAEGFVSPTLAAPLHALALAYAAAILGFATLWFTIVTILVARQARHGLPFSLAWWSFTFPVGTCVTGFAALAHETGLLVVTVAALATYAVLVIAWLTVASRTFYGAVVTGELFLPPEPGRTAR